MGSASPIDSLVIGMALDRFAIYCSLIFLFGTGLFTTLLAPEQIARETWKRLHLFLGTAVTLTLLGTLLWLPLESAEIGGSWNGAVQPAMLQLLLFTTTFGVLWFERTVACLLLTGAYLMLPCRSGRLAVFLLSAASLISLAFIGHAAMEDGPLGDLHRANDMIHILSAASWVGYLVPIVLCLTRFNTPDLRPYTRIALIRFSLLGHVAVTLIFLTGMANTYLIVKRWPVNFDPLYLRLLLCKVALVLVMVALAVVNRYVLVPAIRTRGQVAVDYLKHITFAEIGMAVGVLALVSLFGLLDPR